jgi:NAD(P)H-flavin reductase
MQESSGLTGNRTRDLLYSSIASRDTVLYICGSFADIVNIIDRLEMLRYLMNNFFEKSSRILFFRAASCCVYY